MKRDAHIFVRRALLDIGPDQAQGVHGFHAAAFKPDPDHLAAVLDPEAPHALRPDSEEASAAAFTTSRPHLA